MRNMENTTASWSICLVCNGRGKKSQKLRKKVRLAYQLEVAQFEKSNDLDSDPVSAPVRPKAHLVLCKHCTGSGLIAATQPPKADTENLPHVAIIGGGIGGVALAVACLHRGIPFTLYERDSSFNDRSQGYGLTLQQASKAIEGFGIFSLKAGVISTRHVVHTTDGNIIGEWGIRKWVALDKRKPPTKTNVHVARQALRIELLEQLVEANTVQWNHQFLNYKQLDNHTIALNFMVNGMPKSATANLVVGADGIRSAVRQQLIGDTATPLGYLNCIVILGICPLSALQGVESNLLDSATVFQTANGDERIYIMPFNKDSVMWQLSFPMLEHAAQALSDQGAKALKEEAVRRTPWHHPIPQIVAATLEAQVSGYPVYDRAVLQAGVLAQSEQVTLIGDAAHPMSPFKGQGANQALLDALSLARGISRGCRPQANWKEAGLRKSVLTEFEAEMLVRSASKVKDSADAAQFLHSDAVLHEGNEPRGRHLKRVEE